MTQINALTSPRLNTILMVEDVLKNHNDSSVSVAELKKLLPKQVNHNTLKVILEYLENSNKIAVSMKGITWLLKFNRKGTDM
jgi:hypothetical protein